MNITDEMVLAGSKAANPLAWDGEYMGMVSDITREETLNEVRRILTAALAPAVGGPMQIELDDASNACLELCSKHGFATGHGDTVADMIREIDGQIATPAVGGERELLPGEAEADAWIASLPNAAPAVGVEALADKLDAHAIRYANDYGYGIAVDLKDAAAALRAQPAGGDALLETILAELEDGLNVHRWLDLWRSDGRKIDTAVAIGFYHQALQDARQMIADLPAAQPAPTLLGRESDNPLRAYSVEQLQFELAIRVTWKSGSPPEQTASPLRRMDILKHCDELHDLGFNAGWNGAIEEATKIAQPWAGFWLDEYSTDIDRAVVAVRYEIAEKIHALVSAADAEATRWMKASQP